MWIKLEDIIKSFPKRKLDSHKGTYGKILNIAGSKFYTGAAILSSLSALKVGAGYITLACPDNISNIVASYSPDITLLPLQNEQGCISDKNAEYIIDKSQEYDVISIGSGLSQNEKTQKFIEKIINKINKPLIIDADALNAISMKKITLIGDKTIITPHPKELSRLLNNAVEDIQAERIKYAQIAAKRYGCIVVLKGKDTIVTDEKDYYINSTGNSGLSKAGTGDVLTGIISGITGQQEDKHLHQAASLGVYIHGLAADIAVTESTEYSLLASELINYIPSAIKKIK